MCSKISIFSEKLPHLMHYCIGTKLTWCKFLSYFKWAFGVLVIFAYHLWSHFDKDGKKYTVEREKMQFCNFFIIFLGETPAFNQKEHVIKCLLHLH